MSVVVLLSSRGIISDALVGRVCTFWAKSCLMLAPRFGARGVVACTMEACKLLDWSVVACATIIGILFAATAGAWSVVACPAVEGMFSAAAALSAMSFDVEATGCEESAGTIALHAGAISTLLPAIDGGAGMHAGTHAFDAFDAAILSAVNLDAAPAASSS